MSIKLKDLLDNKRTEVEELFETTVQVREEMTRAVKSRGSIIDLLRYAEDIDYDKDSAVSLAIATDQRVRENWKAILREHNGVTLERAAAASGNGGQERIVYTVQEDEKITVELIQSDIDSDLSLLVINLRDSGRAALSRIDIIGREGSEAFQLEQPKNGLYNVFIENTSPAAIAMRSREPVISVM